MADGKRVSGTEKREDRFQVIATMVADVLFEYQIRTDTMMNQRCIGGEVTPEVYIKGFTTRMANFVYHDDLDVFYKMMEEMQSGKLQIEAEFRISYHSVVYRWTSIQGRTIKSQNGVPLKVVGRVFSIDSKKKQELKLFDDSKRDPMTKLYNKIYVQNSIENVLEESDQKLSALFIVDIDDFKQVNDRLGHLLGDEVLINVASKISRAFRSEDIVGRIGGDEFLAFMYNIGNQEVARERAERICESVKEVYAGNDLNVGVSVSIGLAFFPDHGAHYRELFRKADSALYYSKKMGKSCYTVYEEKNESIDHIGLLFGREGDAAQYTTYGKSRDGVFDEFGYHLIDTVFELMENAKNVDSAVNILLQKAADNYSLAFLSIMVTGDREQSFVSLYEYKKQRAFSMISTEIILSEGDWDEIISCGQNNILVCTNIATKDSGGYRKNYFYENAESWVTVPLYRENRFLGCVCFADIKSRVWSNQELHTFKLFSRIMSAYVLNMRDYETAAALVREMSERDSLTGLYRYEAFLERLNEAIHKTRDFDIAVVYSDIRHFKYLNDTYGYDAGERLIREVSYELAGRESKYRLCGCRVYSDNIITALAIDKHVKKKYIIQEINELIYSIERKFQSRMKDGQFQINTGIYFIQGEDADAKQAVSNANYARKQAKQMAKQGCMVFDEHMRKRLQVRMRVTADFPKAIKNGELRVYYQPKNECISGQVVGAEALIRWQKEDGSFLYPDQFIPVLEGNGMIIDLDYFVFREVLEYIQNRLDQGLEMVPVSVNVSREHLKNDMIFLYVEHLFDEYQVPKQYFEVELTESMCTDNEEKMIQFIQRFKQMGIRVAMDDFGSGYSSLNELSRFPIDILKLDKVFLHGDAFDEQDRIVVSAVVEMAKRLELTVLCEGVETEEQYQFLNRIGCDICQGYYFGRPMPVEAFSSYLESHLRVKREMVRFEFQQSLLDASGKWEGVYTGDQVHYAQGPYGMGAIYFPGGAAGENVLRLPQAVISNLSYTISFWLEQQKMAMWTSAFYVEFCNGFLSIMPQGYNRKLDFRMRDADMLEDQGAYDTGNVTLSGDGWNHIVAVYDSHLQVADLYLNGTKAGHREAVLSLRVPEQVILGGDIDQESFMGSIADLRIYSEALSDMEIYTIYDEAIK